MQLGPTQLNGLTLQQLLCQLLLHWLGKHLQLLQLFNLKQDHILFKLLAHYKMEKRLLQHFKLTSMIALQLQLLQEL